MSIRLPVVVVGLTWLLTVPTSAHHSFAAEFDANLPISLTGVVTKIEWYVGELNPRVEFIMKNLKKHSRNIVKRYHGRGTTERRSRRRRTRSNGQSSPVVCSRTTRRVCNDSS